MFNDTPMEEVSGVFFLTLLTSSSLCPHSLLWRKYLECSSSPCSLRYPCDLTLMEEVSGVFFLTAHFVIPVISLTSSSLCPHSLLWRKVLECSSSLLTSLSLCPHSFRHPCVLTHFVIPVFSHHDLSSHPSHRYP